MCEICGGPHFTVKCAQYEGSSAYYYANHYVQPQPYFSQGYFPYLYEEPYHQPQQQNSEAYDQDRLDRIMDNLAQLLATDETTQRRIQEHEVLLQNQQSIFSDIICSLEEISRKLDEVEETKNMGIIDFGCEEEEIMMQLANCGIVRESDSDMQESQEEPETKMVNLDPPLVLHEEKEEKEERVEEPQKPAYGYTYDEEGNHLGYTIKSGELITTFPEPGKELYKDDVEDEEQNIPEPETTMDAEVPPPRPKDTEADFWSDSEDDEAEAEAWAAYQREFLLRKEIIEEDEVEEIDIADAVGWLFDKDVEEKEVEEIELRECVGLMFGVEEESEEVVEEKLEEFEEIERCVPSLEEEFGEELVDIPKTEKSEEDEFLDLDIGSLGGCEGIDAFDSTTDMDYFDALLEDGEEIVEPTLIKELKCRDVVADEEHHCHPVEEFDEKAPPLFDPQEIGNDRSSRKLIVVHIRLVRNQPKKKKRLKGGDYHSWKDMSYTVFDRGKFPKLKVDLLSFLNKFLHSTRKFLMINHHRVELNGLDRVQVKEKPPD